MSHCNKPHMHWSGHNNQLFNLFNLASVCGILTQLEHGFLTALALTIALEPSPMVNHKEQ